MATLNRVQLIGNLGGDVEHRVTPGGTSVGNFSVATTESFKNKEGEKVEKTEWHRVVGWGGLADLCSKYLQKGSSVYVDGRIEQREFLDKEDKRQVSFEVIASNVQFLGKTKGKGSEAKSDGAETSAPTGLPSDAGEAA